MMLRLLRRCRPRHFTQCRSFSSSPSFSDNPVGYAWDQVTSAVNYVNPFRTPPSHFDRIRFDPAFDLDDIQAFERLYYNARLQRNPEDAIDYINALQDIAIDDRIPVRDLLLQASPVENYLPTWIPRMGGEPTLLTQALMDALLAAQEFTGLPWWATIASLALVYRAALSTSTLYGQKLGVNYQKFSSLRKLLHDVYGGIFPSEAPFQRFLRVRRAAVHVLNRQLTRIPVMIGLIGAQISFHMCLASAIRRMCYVDPSIREGGMAWFTDLSLADPTYALPAISCALFYLSLSFQTEQQARNEEMYRHIPFVHSPVGWLTHRMTFFMQTAAILALPIYSRLPAGVFMLWIPSHFITGAVRYTVTTRPFMKWIGYYDPHFTVKDLPASRFPELHCSWFRYSNSDLRRAAVCHDQNMARLSDMALHNQEQELRQLQTYQNEQSRKLRASTPEYGGGWLVPGSRMLQATVRELLGKAPINDREPSVKQHEWARMGLMHSLLGKDGQLDVAEHTKSAGRRGRRRQKRSQAKQQNH